MIDFFIVILVSILLANTIYMRKTKDRDTESYSQEYKELHGIHEDHMIKIEKKIDS